VPKRRRHVIADWTWMEMLSKLFHLLFLFYFSQSNRLNKKKNKKKSSTILVYIKLPAKKKKLQLLHTDVVVHHTIKEVELRREIKIGSSKTLFKQKELEPPILQYL
jgi:hypothetical protein